MTAAPSTPILVKRYASERLYDTLNLRYVSRDDLRNWGLAKLAFRVIDAQTGEDVTGVLVA